MTGLRDGESVARRVFRDDRSILDLSQTLYGAYKLKRVYYSAFSPIPDARITTANTRAGAPVRDRSITPPMPPSRSLTKFK